MSRAAARLVTVVTLSAVIGLVAPTASAADGHIIIRIYDTGAAPPDLRAAAIRAAAAILEEAGVAAAWHDCTDGLTTACQTPRSPRDLIVRIMPTAGASHIPGAAELHANVGDSDLPLGFAVVDPSTRTGAMATIFQDQVLMVARRNGADASELLGRTLAHEVGHLLLRAMGHSRTGLMRAVWTDAELITNRHDDWVFTSHERRQFGR
jgi:hypothetical protein